MTIAGFVTELSSRGVVLEEEDGKLRYRAPAGTMTEDLLSRLRENKDAVLEHLRGADDPRLVPDPEARHEPFPLTDVQSAYLLGRGSAFDYGSVACHGYLELALPHLDHAALEQGWNDLIAEHDMLRAVVHADGFQRVLAETPHYGVREQDLRGADAATVRASVGATRDELSHKVRATDQWPLFDLRTTRTDDGLLLHVSVDLLICDYSSVRALLTELGERAAGSKRTEPVQATFRDYVLAARGARDGDRYERDRQYWWDRIDDLPAAPDLPVLPQSRAARPRFTRHGMRLSAESTRALEAAATGAGITSSSALLTAFTETIGRWSRGSRFTLSLTVQNRLPLHPDVDRIVGDFSSVSLLTVDLDDGGTLGERAAAIQARLWEDLDHRLCSGVDVLRELTRRRGREAALMPVTFTSTVSGGSGSLMPGARLEYGISQTPQVWIDCQVMAEAGGLLVHWDVREGVFPDGLVEDMFAVFEALVGRMTEPDGPWDEPDPATLPARQLRLLAEANDTAVERTPAALHAEVVAQAGRTPDHLAVLAPDRGLVYAELLGRARATAAALRAKGCVPGERVGIVMDKGWEQVVAVLGTLLAGGAYLPVDVNQPPLRRDAILSDAGVRTVLTQSWLASSLGEATIAVDVLGPIDTGDAEDHRPDPGDLAYVIYTSGSTGTPKGVMIGHAAARNTIDDINARFGIGADDRVLGVAQLGFDLSVYDIFGPLAVGGALVLPAADRRGDPSHWAELVRRHEITVWNSVPAQLQMLREYLGASGAEVSRLRLAMLSGDWIPVTLPDAIRALVPGLAVVSLGGATEGSIWSIYHEIGEVRPDQASIPYGSPLANQSFHVLDSRWRDCPELVTGELFIGGDGLAQGYFGDPARTAERFVTHPRTGQRLYRTGDLGRRLPDGEIEFLGREDGQVKIRAHRVELAEIEAALHTHPAVAAAAVVTHDTGTGKRLAGFVESHRRTETPALPVELGEVVAENAAHTAAGLDGDRIREMAALLDASALGAMMAYLREEGLFTSGDAAHTAEEIIKELRADPANHHLMRRWLAALTREGRLALDAASGRYRALTVEPEQERTERRHRIDELEPQVGWGAELVRYHRESEAHLGELVRDEMQMTTMLFPEGKLDTARAAYRDNLISRYLNTAVVAAVRWIAERHHAPHPVRLLEVGAGVGGTSTVLVPALDDLDVDYLFTDVSHFFLNEAGEQFLDRPSVRYGLFDINQDIRAQGLTPNSFDVILCANVLHNSAHAGEVLERLRELAAPGGWLVFIEATRDAYHVMTSMEFKTGLTDFRDERGASGATFFTREQWLGMLREAGAETALCLPHTDDPLSGIGQHVFAARFKADREPVAAPELTAHLAERLPEYMIPADLQIVDRIPLTANGKVDRARLTAWTGTGAGESVAEANTPPADELESTLAGLWSDILHVPVVSREADFFALGGDSLLVAQLLGRVRETLPVARVLDWDDLLRQVLTRPTVAALAAFLRDTGRDRSADSTLVAVGERARPGTDEPTVVFVHDGTGTVLPYRALSAELSGVPMAGLVLDDLESYVDNDPAAVLTKLADRHAEAILAAGHGRVHLVGYCMGGLLVTDIAARLNAAGVTVTDLTIVSSYRVPYRVEDDLLAEYIFARVMRADPAKVGYPEDESGLAALVAAATARYGDRVPPGSLTEISPDDLDAAGAQALKYLRELADTPQADRLRAIGAHMPAADSGLAAPERLGKLYRVIKHSLAAVAAHQPAPYTEPVTFVRQTGEAQVFPGMLRDMTEHWQRVCVGGLDIVDVGGDHFTCVEPPQVAAVAQAVRRRP